MDPLIEHNRQIAQYVRDGKCVSITKIGTERLHTLNHYMAAGTTANLNEGVRNGFYINSGVFPKDPKHHDRACRLILQSLLDTTHMSIGATPTSNTHKQNNPIFQKYKHLDQIFPQAIEPFRSTEPWTRELKGKTVLVAHPFTTTIANQFIKKDLVWGNRVNDFLPFDDLELLELPMSYHLYDQYPYEYTNWVDMIQDLKDQIVQKEFDVFICGGGAMAIPLCAFARSMGKTAIDSTIWVINMKK